MPSDQDDGKRYVASTLKDKTRKDMTAFRDFYESDKKDDVIEEANENAMDTGLPVLVFDRKEHMVIHRFDPVESAAEAEEELEAVQEKKSKKKK